MIEITAQETLTIIKLMSQVDRAIFVSSDIPDYIGELLEYPTDLLIKKLQADKE